MADTHALSAGPNRPERTPMFRTQVAAAIDGARSHPSASGGGASRRPSSRPTQTPGTYRLPHEVVGRLRASLAAFRNAERAFTLATFLGRYWSSRARMARPFPIDRRALADRDDLGLTEGQIRGAMRVLEEVGFLNRGEPPAGSAYKATPDGLQRKPILYGFGADYGPAFAVANARADRARGRAVERRSITSSPNLPKDKASSERWVFMGKSEGAAERQRVARPVETNPALESALRKLGEAGGFVGREPHPA